MKAVQEMTIEELAEKLKNSTEYQEQYIAEMGKRSKIHDRRIKTLTKELESRS